MASPDTLNAGYFRSPSIAGDRVVFLSEDDVWTAPRGGGVARRLTSNLGPVGRTIVSPTGELIAFTGTEEAHAEVYVMPADGGPARRITYLGANTQVRGWAPDGRVVFMTDAGRANRADWMIHLVDPDGGIPEKLPVGTATEIAFAPDGAGLVLGRHTIDPARWKRYRGGTRGDIWIDATGRGTFRRILNLEGNLASPLWVGNRVYFLSDHEGIGNLYSCTPSGRDIRRHTDHDKYYARWASSDGRRVVYQLAAEIWTYDPATDASERIDVDFRSPRIQRSRRFVKAAKYMHGWRIHPEGHSIAVTSRGKLHTMPLWEQAARQYGSRDGVRYRLAQWTNDGESIVCVSDEGGEEALDVYSTSTGIRAKRLGRIDLGRAIEMSASPARPEVVVANHRNELIWVNVNTNRSKLLDSSRFARISGATWSPDGRFVAYACSESQRTTSIKLCEVASGETQLVTRPDFHDVAPSFDPDGRYLYFLSYRVFDPVYDQLYFALMFPRTVRPHVVTLRPDEPSPFAPKPRGLGEDTRDDGDDGADGADRRSKRSTGGDKARRQRVDIDFEGIADRVLAFPVPEGRYSQVHGIRGKVLFTSFPVSGSLRQDWFDIDEEPKGKLEVYDFAHQRHDTLVEGINGFRVAADGKTLVYQARRKLRAIKAGEKPDAKKDKSEPSRRSGWIDLGRIRVSVDPPSEWRQMYREAWRFQREHFWVADMSGVDWEAIYERYRPLVEKVGSRLEFSDLMWEMLGELGTSHAYEIGGDVRPPPPYRVGHLAADVSLRNGLWVIEHIVRGDSWDPLHNSPLAAPGANVNDGDTILAVNGQLTSADTSPQWLLVNHAGIDVELVVGDGRGANPRTVVVRTLVDATPARYREWVETNRRIVHERTNGRVGYVHIPDMGPPGYAEFHRYYLSEVERDGLVIDVRFNAGGHVSSLILEKLARERLGYVVTRWGEIEPYWEDSPAGPLVCITNELAGSDGDIFTHVFKLKGLGPVVGKRTWGGVVGINLRHILVDNGITTQPEYGFWFGDVGWGVENYGTDPTHDVDITPQDYANDRDPQMDTALRLVMHALRRHKPIKPDMRTRPRLTLPVLPPRDRRTKAKPTRQGKRRLR